jgi:hypothetical protein
MRISPAIEASGTFHINCEISSILLYNELMDILQTGASIKQHYSLLLTHPTELD